MSKNFPNSLFWKEGVTIPYNEDIDEDGYSYEFLINYDGREGLIFICESGGHVEWEDSPGFTAFNLVPERIFGKQEYLNEKQLRALLNIICKIGFEGFFYSEEEVDRLYQKWVDEGKH